MYHDVFNPDAAEVEDLKARYRAGKVGDVEVKTKLARAMNAALEPMRERRREVMARPERVREILVEGSRKARVIAQATMERVRDAVKLRDTDRSALHRASRLRILAGRLQGQARRRSRGRSICCCTSFARTR